MCVNAAADADINIGLRRKGGLVRARINCKIFAARDHMTERWGGVWGRVGGEGGGGRREGGVR